MTFRKTVTMKNLLFVLIAVVIAHSVFAADAKPGRKPVQRTPEQKRLSSLKHHGGFLLQPGRGHGKVALVNASGLACDDAFAQVASDIGKYIRISATSGKSAAVTLSTIEAALASSGAQAAVFGVADDTMPRLLIAPEQRWAIVNVKALKEGNPADEVFKKRVRKELWRAFAMTCGATDTRTPECALNPVVSLADLDRSQNDMISMERLNEISDHLKKIDIEPFRMTSYRQACKEGWAPAPTNEFQQALWDKFRSEKEQGPVNGIKIPMPKK